MATLFEDLRDAVDELKLLHSADPNENCITFITDADEECIRFLYSVDEEKQTIYSISLIANNVLEDNDFHAAYKFCNNWNVSFKYPKAYVNLDRKVLVCEWTWYMENGRSREMLEQNVLQSFISLSRFFFVDALRSGICRKA